MEHSGKLVLACEAPAYFVNYTAATIRDLRSLNENMGPPAKLFSLVEALNS